MIWSWLLSGLGLASLILLGRKSRWGFVVGLVADFAWGWYSLTTHQWGFLPACLVYMFVHVRSYRKWA